MLVQDTATGTQWRTLNTKRNFRTLPKQRVVVVRFNVFTTNFLRFFMLPAEHRNRRTHTPIWAKTTDRIFVIKLEI